MCGHDFCVTLSGGGWWWGVGGGQGVHCTIPSVHTTLGISSLFMANLPIILNLCNIVLLFSWACFVVVYNRMVWVSLCLGLQYCLFVCLFIIQNNNNNSEFWSTSPHTLCVTRIHQFSFMTRLTYAVVCNVCFPVIYTWDIVWLNQTRFRIIL